MLHTPLKKFGQNFLTQPALAKKIVDALSISAQDNVIEIGPGAGILTSHIIEKKPNSFWAIEFDPRWAENAEHEFGNDVIVLNQDFLKTDLAGFDNPNAQLKIIGNIPYNITSPILFKLLEYFPKVDVSVLMMQKEVARRIVSSPGSKEWGILSVLMQTFADISYLFEVNKKNFKPIPKVDSAVLKFNYLSEVSDLENIPLFKRIVKGTFNYRRKMLRNSLIRMFDQSIVSSVDFIDLSRRPEQLSIAEFKKLTGKINQLLS